MKSNGSMTARLHSGVRARMEFAAAME